MKYLPYTIATIPTENRNKSGQSNLCHRCPILEQVANHIHLNQHVYARITTMTGLRSTANYSPINVNTRLTAIN